MNRLLRNSLLLVLGGLLVGPAMARTSPRRKKTMVLSGKVSKTQDQLIIDYQIRNNRERPIFVWDQMINYNESGQVIDPDLAYVFWEEPGTVRIVRAMLNTPPDIDVTKKEVPFVRKLAPGQTAEGRIALKLPLREYSPFYTPTEEVKQVPCTKISLIIGWIDEQEGMVAKPRDVGGKEVLALRGTWKPPFQRLARFDISFPAVLLVRKDSFDRRMPLE